MEKNKLVSIGTKAFSGVFESMQLLGFAILYYNFDYGEEELIWFNNQIKANNQECLDNIDLYNANVELIEKTTGWDVSKKVKEFPYRARVGMMGGLPQRKGSHGLQAFNMANLESFSAIESYMVLCLPILIKKKKWGKTQCDLWWSNMKSESLTYGNKQMSDEFMKQYLHDQTGVTFQNGKGA